MEGLASHKIRNVKDWQAKGEKKAQAVLHSLHLYRTSSTIKGMMTESIFIEEQYFKKKTDRQKKQLLYIISKTKA